MKMFLFAAAVMLLPGGDGGAINLPGGGGLANAISVNYNVSMEAVVFAFPDGSELVLEDGGDTIIASLIMTGSGPFEHTMAYEVAIAGQGSISPIAPAVDFIEAEYTDKNGVQHRIRVHIIGTTSTAEAKADARLVRLLTARQKTYPPK